MAQTFPNIAASDKVRDSRQPLLDRDEAIRSCFSGSSAPSGAVLGQLWFNTSTGVLSQLTGTGPDVWEAVRRGTVEINQGGTGATNASDARDNLELGAVAVLNTIGNAHISDVAFSKLTSKPTTISGYGITDAASNTITVTAGSGLTGGGNLTASRTLAIDFTRANTWTGAQTFQGPVAMDSSAPSVAATITCDVDARNFFDFTLNQAGHTLNLTGSLKKGPYTFIARQDATGGRTITTYPPQFKWMGGAAPTLTATANKADIICGISDGTNIYVSASLNG